MYNFKQQQEYQHSFLTGGDTNISYPNDCGYSTADGTLTRSIAESSCFVDDFSMPRFSGENYAFPHKSAANHWHIPPDNNGFANCSRDILPCKPAGDGALEGEPYMFSPVTVVKSDASKLNEFTSCLFTNRWYEPVLTTTKSEESTLHHVTDSELMFKGPSAYQHPIVSSSSASSPSASSLAYPLYETYSFDPYTPLELKITGSADELSNGLGFPTNGPQLTWQQSSNFSKKQDGGKSAEDDILIPFPPTSAGSHTTTPTLLSSPAPPPLPPPTSCRDTSPMETQFLLNENEAYPYPFDFMTCSQPDIMPSLSDPVFSPSYSETETMATTPWPDKYQPRKRTKSLNCGRSYSKNPATYVVSSTNEKHSTSRIQGYPTLSRADVEATQTNPSAIPRRQRPRHEDDNYTPKWVRYTGYLKEGYCDSCKPGKWLQLKNSAYWYHKQFYHGISSVSGKKFIDPLEERRVDTQGAIEGLCHQCQRYVPISSGKRRNNLLWYRHAHKCHVYDKVKSVKAVKKTTTMHS